jgi:hypothetical protein
MTFDDWWWSEFDPSAFSPLDMGDMKKAYDAGFKEACRRYNLREDPEEYQVSQGFDEYPYYGENNPPVGELK